MQRSRKGYFDTQISKKAIVKVKKGQKIALFEEVVEEEVKVTTGEGEGISQIKEKKSLLGGTKVKIEKTNQNQSFASSDKGKLEREMDPQRPTKESQKEEKKGK